MGTALAPTRFMLENLFPLLKEGNRQKWKRVNFLQLKHLHLQVIVVSYGRESMYFFFKRDDTWRTL